MAHRQRCRPRLCGGGSSLLTTASGTPPNCELRGPRLQLPLNDDSGRLRRKDALKVYIGTNAPTGPESQTLSMSREAVPNLNQCSRVGTDRGGAEFCCANDAVVDGRSAQGAVVRKLIQADSSCHLC